MNMLWMAMYWATRSFVENDTDVLNCALQWSPSHTNNTGKSEQSWAQSCIWFFVFFFLFSVLLCISLFKFVCRWFLFNAFFDYNHCCVVTVVTTTTTASAAKHGYGSESFGIYVDLCECVCVVHVNNFISVLPFYYSPMFELYKRCLSECIHII